MAPSSSLSSSQTAGTESKFKPRSYAGYNLVHGWDGKESKLINQVDKNTIPLKIPPVVLRRMMDEVAVVSTNSEPVAGRKRSSPDEPSAGATSSSALSVGGNRKQQELERAKMDMDEQDKRMKSLKNAFSYLSKHGNRDGVPVGSMKFKDGQPVSMTVQGRELVIKRGGRVNHFVLEESFMNCVSAKGKDYEGPIFAVEEPADWLEDPKSTIEGRVFKFQIGDASDAGDTKPTDNISKNFVVDEAQLVIQLRRRMDDTGKRAFKMEEIITIGKSLNASLKPDDIKKAVKRNYEQVKQGPLMHRWVKSMDVQAARECTDISNWT